MKNKIRKKFDIANLIYTV